MTEAQAATQRVQTLVAMGIDVYELRSRKPALSVPTIADKPSHSDGVPRVFIVCAHGRRSDMRLANFYAQLPRALGVSPDAIGWCEAGSEGTFTVSPSAPAYLVIGATMARAFGAQLSTMQQNASTIAVTADPAQLPGSAADKRALWQILKPLARRLREQSA